MGGPVIDLLGGWTFEATLPVVFAYAQQAYNAWAPLVWVLAGMLVAFYAIRTIIRIVRAAVGDED